MKESFIDQEKFLYFKKQNMDVTKQSHNPRDL